ncbi:MAG: glycogen synthase GlgA [Acidobacteria bacterium]|nr:MAG: glycogen synthase GlgA [Acidobacteriota bacterium]
MRIVIVASEGVPFSKTGGLADVVGSLPKALAEAGQPVEVILPRYRMTKPGNVLPPLASLTIPLASGFRFAAIQDGGESKGVHTLLVDLPEFFGRDGLYQDKGTDYPDNAARFAAFSLAALEAIKRTGGPPDVLHCHDWQSALVPIYLRNLYSSDPFFAGTSVLLTVHNLGYQGLFPPHILPQISLHAGLFTIEGLEFYGKVNLLKGGLVFSDFINTVSRKYAEEIQTEEYGCGLDGVLRSRAGRVTGILNGVDYDAWDPATDKLIPANFSPADVKGKLACKKALLQGMGARDVRPERPLIGIVARFAAQKGFDLIADIAGPLMAMDIYVVALGTGEPLYEDLFKRLAAKFPDKFFAKVAYDNNLAHQIEAGADIFLMPSRYEPCGLNQIYSLKYGTVPVVRATGGLDDTIEAFDGNSGTGFKFDEYSPKALLASLKEAVTAFQNQTAWRRLMLNGMRKDFSWATSARQYEKIYQMLVKEKSKSRPAAVAAPSRG